jgi:hypothetical protein
LLAAAAVEQKTLPTVEKIDTSAADRDFSYSVAALREEVRVCWKTMERASAN